MFELAVLSSRLYREITDWEWNGYGPCVHRAALEAGKAISTDGRRTYRFSAPSDDTDTALSVLVLDPYGITDGDSL